MTVAALYVTTGGVYFDLEGVEPWDELRDARAYAGSHPVVAHPPCASWYRGAGSREARGYGLRGDDGGCFESALAAVRTFGGVLEHPAHSAAWAEYGLSRPLGREWAMTLGSTGIEWVAEVDQAEWGLRAHKPTWLYYIGSTPPLPLVGPCDARGARPGPQDMHSGHRHLTPAAFRDDLLRVAAASAA